MSLNNFSKCACLLIFAMAFILPGRCLGFELDKCEACLEEDICVFCVKSAADGTQVGVCDCDDSDVESHGDCEESNWNAKVTMMSACNLLAYPKTSSVVVLLLVLMSFIIVCTGCIVVTQFFYRNICCCCRRSRKDNSDNSNEMINLKEQKGHELI